MIRGRIVGRGQLPEIRFVPGKQDATVGAGHWSGHGGTGTCWKAQARGIIILAGKGAGA